MKQKTQDGSKGCVKPFLKWAGGKSQLLNELEKRIPNHIKKSKRIERYFEPFVGGGAFFFYLMSNYAVENAYINDVNKELMLTYNVIKKDPKNLIDELCILHDKYILKKSNDLKKKYYYGIRSLFNSSLNNFNFEEYSNEHILRASKFIFLNKTCFNGLFRVNKKGEFNVPCACPKNPLICDRDNILNISKLLKNTHILSCDFLDLEDLIVENSFVYLDPPYRPLNNTSSFNGYSNNGFDDNDQIQLAEFYKRLSDKGAYVLLSNSDPKNTNVEDNFFDELYKDFKIERVDAKRFINSNGNKRGPIKEILVSNF